MLDRNLFFLNEHASCIIRAIWVIFMKKKLKRVIILYAVIFFFISVVSGLILKEYLSYYSHKYYFVYKYFTKKKRVNFTPLVSFVYRNNSNDKYIRIIIILNKDVVGWCYIVMIYLYILTDVIKLVFQ